MMGKLTLVALLALGMGCGDEGSTVEAESIAAGDLDCPTGGVLLTVDGAESVICNGASGADGPAGEAGAAGEAGPVGPDGAQGDPGTDGFVSVDSFSCYAEPVLPGGYTASVFYGGHTFANGYLFTSCSIQSTATGDAAANLYTPDQVGEETTQCVALGDSNMLVDGGWWDFKTLDDGTRRATYHDPVAADDGAFYDFTAADCQ